MDAPGARGRLGDRVERAIDQHTDLAGEIERSEAEPRPRGSLRRTLLWLAVTGTSLYLVAPSVLEVLRSWRSVRELSPAWLAAMAALQGAVLLCLWALQCLALHTRGWYAVATSQLAGNALSKVAPGGGALGAALQYRMLVQAGLARGPVVSGLTAASLLVFAVVLALPVLALPALLRGSVNRDLVEATLVGLGVFVAVFAVGVVLLAFDRPLRWVGRTLQRLRNRVRRHSEPLTGLPTRLVRERDRILGTLGASWKRALAATVGRWAFDYLTLLAALAAVGAHPRPALVLLAFCAAQLLAQIPVTPGGLGFVEAGLTATLSLAGVAAGDAVLATFAYRLFSYWLMLPLGLVGVALHRRRFAGGAVHAPGQDSCAQPDQRARPLVEEHAMDVRARLLDQLIVRPGEAAAIGDRDPGWTGGPDFSSLAHHELEERARNALREGTAELSEAQELLWASDRYAVLVVLQAMDAAGKDSAIEHVMSGVNPQGVQVVGFKKPSSEELDHDFLWRIARALPERGRIGIFNRSHYEEVVALKVHPEWLEAQRLPPGPRDERFWQARYEDINAFERHLDRSGTRIVKLFLHVSKEVQKERFLARLDTPGKEWKFNADDVAERARWDDYMRAFDVALTATSTPWAPWYVIPADHKWLTQALVAQVLVGTLEALDLSWPEVSAEAHAANLLARRELDAEPVAR